MSWIRVAVAMKGDPRIGGLATAINKDVGATMGYVVALLSELPMHARDGDLTDIPDASLELWALWPGKRGAFARAFVEHLCDDRTVRAWEKHNGAPLRELDAKRQAMADKRAAEKAARDAERDAARTATNGARSPHGGGNRGGNVPPTVTPLRNGTVRSTKTQRSSQSLAPDPTTAADAANGEPVGFAEAMAAYPPRLGDNPRGRALKAWRARLRDDRPTALVEGARRYRTFCDATGKTGTEYVMQAATFYGPDRRYADAWAVPADAVDPIELLVAEQQRQIDDTALWLAQKRAAVSS